MKSYRTFVRLAMIAGWMLLGIGCGGINASKSVSPIDFLIPGGGGLMRGLIYQEPGGDATNAPAGPLNSPALRTAVASAK